MRIQARYAGSTSAKIGSLYVDLFRQVSIVDGEASISAINRWFSGWKSLKALGHELRSEAIFAIAELSLPLSIFSIVFSQLKLSESVLPVPLLMDKLRSVAVESVLRVERSLGADQGLIASSAKTKRKPKPGHSSSLKCTFCQATGHLEDRCFKKHGYPPGHPRAATGATQAAVLLSPPPSESDASMVTDIPRHVSLDTARNLDFGLVCL